MVSPCFVKSASDSVLHDSFFFTNFLRRNRRERSYDNQYDPVLQNAIGSWTNVINASEEGFNVLHVRKVGQEIQ